MKKTLLTVVVLIALVVLAGPFVSGVIAQKQYQTMLVNASQSGQYTLSSGDYQRGWFGSQTVTEMELHGPYGAALMKAFAGEEAEGPAVLRSREQIKHGPILKGELSGTTIGAALLRSEIELPEKMTVALGKYFGGKSPLVVESVVGYDGKISSKYAFASYKGPLENQGVDVVWDGVQGSSRVGKEGKTASLQFIAPRLRLKKQDHVDMSFTGMELTGDMQRGDLDIWFGESKAVIDSIAVEGNDQALKAFKLAGFELSTVQAERGEVMDGISRLNIAAINADGQEFGPATLDVALKNLDIAAMANLQSLMRQLSSEGDVENSGQAITAAWVEALEASIKHSPELELNRLKFRVNNEEVNASARFYIQGAEEVQPGNLMAYVPFLKAEFDAQLPQALVKGLMRTKSMQSMADSGLEGDELNRMVEQSVDMQLMMLHQQKVFVPEGDNFIIAIRLADSQLTLNGEDASALLGLGQAMMSKPQ